MYLSTTQILKRLGKARNKKNADIVRDYLANSGEIIGGVFRVEEEVFEEYFGELVYELDKPKPFAESQINSVTSFESTILEQSRDIHDLKINHTSLVFRAENQDKRILDLESEIALFKFRLEKAEKAISNIIEIFYNVNKLKGE